MLRHFLRETRSSEQAGFERPVDGRRNEQESRFQHLVEVRSARPYTRIDIIQLLLDHGAELNSRTDDGRTPMSEAMRHNRQEAVEFLKSKGAVDDPAAAKLNTNPD